jgi:hypothetical protein
LADFPALFWIGSEPIVAILAKWRSIIDVIATVFNARSHRNELPNQKWNEEDYDVLANGEVVGRVFKVNAAPVGSPWMWTLAFGYHRDRTPNHGYTATREAAMAAFAKSWRRE